MPNIAPAPIKVVQMGCGPIGCRIATLAASKNHINVVGAIDLTHAGRSLGELTGCEELQSIIISDDANAVLETCQPDVVMHATGSTFQGVFPQLQLLLEGGVNNAGVNIVSTCEELSYPFYHQPELSAQLNKLAQDNNKTVLATGVNPGFLMDAWPSFMTGICTQVDSIRCLRRQDAAPRRIQFQQKIGAGLAVDKFKQRVEQGQLRHMGLPESAAMIAAAMGWSLDKIIETVEPAIADQPVNSADIYVQAGEAAGVKQTVRAFVGGNERITLDFQAYIGAQDVQDKITINGSPSFDVVVKDGVQGDDATAAMMVNAVANIVTADAGLKTMKDIAMVVAAG